MQNCLIMGIVNVTPDSFSDGGHFFTPDSALEQIETLLADGADIIDLGAESSRPNADAVSAEEEWRRLEPVLKALAGRGLTISVDTYKPETMQKLLAHEVAIINDIRGASLVEDAFLKQWAAKGRTYLAMHMHRDPKTMQGAPLDKAEAARELDLWYKATQERFRRLGYPADKIWLDPGIGFGKTDAANLYLMKDAMRRASDLAIALGISRKSFLGRLLDLPEPLARDSASKMLELSFLYAEVKVIRTHNVKHLKRLRDQLLG